MFKIRMLLLALGLIPLAACSTTGQTPAWTPTQVAYVELASYEALQSAVGGIVGAAGLSPRTVADIKAAEAAATAALSAQASSLAGGAGAGDQAVSALTDAAVQAASQLQSVISAQHGATTATSIQLAEAGGLAVLTDAPAVLAAVNKIRSGTTPTTADISIELDRIQAQHQQIQGP